MGLYRYYLLDEHDKIVFEAWVECSDLAAAVAIARASVDRHEGASPDRIEIWHNEKPAISNLVSA